MLMLTLELELGPGRTPLPAHLGGALHGFVERGVKNHAPHLLPVLRPNGLDQAAHFMILPPPLWETIEDHFRFGVILYGACEGAWPVMLRALLSQQCNGLNGRRMHIRQAWSTDPAGDTYALLTEGNIVEGTEEPPITRNVQNLAESTPHRSDSVILYRLSFRSPLLLASRKAQRDRRRILGGLPWPSLASILDSIAERMRCMEPELANALNLAPDWSAPEAARGIEPLTPAALPASQVEWEYSATPRVAADESDGVPDRRRTFPIPGIVGDLIYPATGIEHEHSLLYWGQWLGVGQKTTMGCGCYALRDQ